MGNGEEWKNIHTDMMMVFVSQELPGDCTMGGVKHSLRLKKAIYGQVDEIEKISATKNCWKVGLETTS